MNVNDAVRYLTDELERAERKFPYWPTDMVHAAAIVAEEAGELVQASLQASYEHGSDEKAFKEAVHTGAMALRFILNHSVMTPTMASQVRRDHALQRPQPESAVAPGLARTSECCATQCRNRLSAPSRGEV